MIRNLGDRPGILEVDSLLRQPLLRVKPLRVIPRRRITAVHSDKDDSSGWRWNVEGTKISGDLRCRVYARLKGVDRQAVLSGNA